MARHTRLSNLSVNTEANALAALLDGGVIEIYDGKQPDRAESPPESSPIIVLKFGNPGFRPAVVGVLISNPIQPGVAVRTGKPTWARLCQADGTPVMSISAGTHDAVLTIPVAMLEIGMPLTIESFSHTIPKE